MFIEYVVLFLISFSSCALIVLTRRSHARFTMRRADHLAVQAAHRAPTPRIGGIGLVGSVAVALVWVPDPTLSESLGLFSISLLPVFLVGLAEDLGCAVSPRRRVLAAAASSVLAMALLGMWIPRTDIPVLDPLVTFAPVGIALTLLWMTGLCHAINLIDGLNGLSSGVGAIIAAGLGAMAARAGDPALAMLAFAMVPAILGFLVLNWPFGLIFLGDAGAYTLGHVLGWLGIILAVRNPEVAGIAVGLVFFWPVADTLFAIWRRRRSGQPADQPDRLHFHQLAMRALEILFGARNRRRVTNPVTSVVLLPLAVAPVVAGVLLQARPGTALLALVLFCLLFAGSYLAILALCPHARARPAGRSGRSVPSLPPHAGE